MVDLGKADETEEGSLASYPCGNHRELLACRRGKKNHPELTPPRKRWLLYKGEKGYLLETGKRRGVGWGHIPPVGLPTGGKGDDLCGGKITLVNLGEARPAYPSMPGEEGEEAV